MSGQRKFLVAVRVKPNIKDCFVGLSPSLARECSNNGFNSNVPPSITIEDSSQNRTFVSWLVSKSDVDQGASYVLYIGKHFSSALKIKNEDMVYVYPLTAMEPCQQVFVAPVNSEEWEIVELNSQSIEQNLLNQIRIVYPGLTFPIFLKGSAIVLLKIEKIVPARKCSYLEEFTELHIAQALTESKHQTSEKERQIKTSTNVHKSIFQAPASKICKNTRTLLKNSSRKEQNEPFDIWSHLSKLVNNTIFDNVAKKVEHREENDDIIADVKHMEKLMRIHPITFPNNESMKGVPLESPQEKSPVHPFQVFVNENCFKLLNCHTNSRDVTGNQRMIMKITRLITPTERRNAKKKGNKENEKTTQVTFSKSAFVDVCSISSSSCHLPVLSCNVAVGTEVLHHLEMQKGMIVRMECVHEEPAPISGIILTVLENEDSILDDEAIAALFGDWIRGKCSSCSSGIVVNDDAVFRIGEETGPDMLVSIRILTTERDRGPGRRYFWLDSDLLDSVTIAVEHESRNEFQAETSSKFRSMMNDDNRSSRVISSMLGGVKNYFERAQAYWNNIFENAQHAGSVETGLQLQNGSLLICGSSRSVAGGSGRTSLARAICSFCEQAPYFAHIEVIECTSLRGKKPENILSRFSTAFEEARWRQPSVVVLDDLDDLIYQPDPIKDAAPTLLYQSRLAEGLKDLLREEMELSNQIAIIIIAKCKDSLPDIFNLASGWHFIKDSLVLAPPDLEMRANIIDVLIKKAGCNFTGDEGTREIAALTEGHLPADLNAIVRRAKHHALCNGSPKEQATLQLRESDFKDALSGYKPLGLHGIDLHKPGHHGWEHVGGLGQAKKILQETFIWPIKHPGLFSKCPLRIRSGILLYGPPGTGKTLLAGVVAKECGMNFVSIKGPELLSKYVGSSEQNVRDLFARAQSASPCILFFDEFDALAPKRGHDNTGVTDRVVNQLLTQLDGVEKLDKVFVLAATSRPDLIDPALLRPGRLDKCVFCAMPDPEERCDILKALSVNLDIVNDLEFQSISQKTNGFSGADIKALLYNAQLKVIHRNYPATSGSFADQEIVDPGSQSAPLLKITMIDIEEAIKETAPSVTISEKKRYKKIYENFMALRKGSAKINERQQRVTLA